MKIACRPAPVSRIFLHGPILRRLSLPVHELDADHWSPVESFPDFFQYRLRPLVYFLHSAVTHGFEKEVDLANYSAPELCEIRYWLTRVLLHCVSFSRGILSGNFFPALISFLETASARHSEVRVYYPVPG